MLAIVNESKQERMFKKWAGLMAQLEALEAEMAAYVEAEAAKTPDKKSLSGVVGGVKWTYTKKGSYDWEALARHMEPDEETISRFEKTVVDFKGLALAMAPSKEDQAAVYSEGSPSISFKVV